MKIVSTKILAAIAMAATVACAGKMPPPQSDSGTTAKLDAALAGAHRRDEERARDKYRHPRETLSFFGLRDDMTVVELFPGRGWYTAVLAPVLAERGKLVLPIGDPNGPDSEYGVKNARAITARIAEAPAVYGKPEIRIQHKDAFDLGAAGSADMVVTSRSLHNLSPTDMTALLTAVRTVLKSGGVFGVVDHRANEGADPAKGGDTGYIPESWLVQTIEAQGFRLAEKSEVNANPKDTKDYEKGVWALPPSLENGDTDREKYLAIGESDRMTLRFVKK